MQKINNSLMLLQYICNKNSFLKWLSESNLNFQGVIDPRPRSHSDNIMRSFHLKPDLKSGALKMEEASVYFYDETHFNPSAFSNFSFLPFGGPDQTPSFHSLGIKVCGFFYFSTLVLDFRVVIC